MGKRRKKTQTEKQQQIYIGKIYIIKQGARGTLIHEEVLNVEY